MIEKKRYIKVLISLILLTILFIVSAALCSKLQKGIPPVYPEYDPAKERGDIVMTVNRISEHRLCVAIENLMDSTVYTDNYFALYSFGGEQVPLTHDLIAGTWQAEEYCYIPANGTREFSLILSLLYGELDAGTYKLVKLISDSPEPGSKYVSLSFELETDMSYCDYPAEPCDFFIYHPGVPSPEGISAEMLEVSSTALKLMVENTGDIDWYPNIKNGEYQLYKVLYGEYMPIRHKHPWGYSAVGYDKLKSGEMDEFNLEWKQSYGELEVGTYAFVGKWSCDDNGEYIETMMATEFQLAE